MSENTNTNQKPTTDKADNTELKTTYYQVSLYGAAQDHFLAVRAAVQDKRGVVLGDMKYEGVGFYFQMMDPGAPHPLQEQLKQLGTDMIVYQLKGNPYHWKLGDW